MAHHFVEGEALQALVRDLSTPVKLIHLDGESGTATPAEALALARSGGWVGKISVQGRLRYLRQFDRRAFTADPTHWDGRGVNRFTTDLREMPERVKRREEAARWDRMLSLDPPPRSWQR